MPLQNKFRYSLVLATRDRINLFHEMLQSVRNTTKEKSELEVIAIIDDDDKNMQNCSLSLTEEFKDINLKIISRPRSEWMNRDYINYSNSFTSGDYLIVLNDDVVFINNSWDIQAYEMIKSYRHYNGDIFLGFTENFNGGNGLCYFPLLSKKTIKALGFVMPPKRKSWGADVDMCELFMHPKINKVKIIMHPDKTYKFQTTKYEQR
jgi:hypothetical protein